jgi:serine/threonine-protein kinase
LSHPAAARPDDTAPSQRAATGFLCPKCHCRFDESDGRRPGSPCPDDGAPLVRVRDMAEADGDPMLGRVLAARFTVLSRLGAGSMGTVYRARQAPIGREVAIKILRSDRAVDAASKGRFIREARANSLLTSPNTVTVFDFGQSEQGELYLAMELLEGESLGQRLKRLGRLGIGAAVDTAKQALRSLAEAHAKGIVHRDVKPDNLFYARVVTNEQPEEIVKVVDFGIAKLLYDTGEPAMNAVETQAGTVFGTPRYMSPEQAQGKALDARSDLYSLGVILYHMLTGRPPFTDDDAIVVMARHIKTMPRAPSEVCPEARIPPEIEAFVMKALSKDPTQRPQSAEAMAKELERALELGTSVSSGVRVSISNDLVAILEKPATPDGVGAATLANETLTAPSGVPTRGKRAMLLAAGGAFVGAVVVAAITYAVTQHWSADAVSLDKPAVAHATAPAPAARPPAATTTAAATSTSTPAATSSPPTIAVSALPKATTGPPPTARPTSHASSPPPPTKPTSTTPPSSTGYGLFE